jgi:hypothetical protein
VYQLGELYGLGECVVDGVLAEVPAQCTRRNCTTDIVCLTSLSTEDVYHLVGFELKVRICMVPPRACHVFLS